MSQRRSRKTKREQKLGKPKPSPPRPKESPQPNRFFVALVAIVGILGLLALFGVFYMLHTISQVAARQEIVRTLPDITRAAPGEAAILEGRVAASEPARYKEFVAYVRERQRGAGGRGATWTQTVSKETPPFAVDAGSRVYRISNGTYAFDRLIWNWTDHKRIDEGPTTWRSAVDIQGVVERSPIMAIGHRLADDGGDAAFHADRVVALSRVEYFDRLVAHKAFLWKFVLALVATSIVGIYLGWRGVRRVME